MTAGSPAAADTRFKLIGRWADVKRTIDVHNLGTKRKMIDEFRELYFSGPRVAGVINRRVVERTAEVLGQPFKDVAACYRSGEAMRCRFLVPSLPAKNETPDELSLAAWPEWVDPGYEEDDEEVPLELSAEERDTAEILIGAA